MLQPVEMLMILDADRTTPLEDLPKFYHALANGKGELINGCRRAYPMEKQAMRFLNLVVNKFFGWFFSYLLGQRLKRHMMWYGAKGAVEDRLRRKSGRSYFGEFDPFGDF